MTHLQVTINKPKKVRALEKLGWLGLEPVALRFFDTRHSQLGQERWEENVLYTSISLSFFFLSPLREIERGFPSQYIRNFPPVRFVRVPLHEKTIPRIFRMFLCAFSRMKAMRSIFASE